MSDHTVSTLLEHEGAPSVAASWSDLQIVRRFRAMNTHIDLYAQRPDAAPILAGAERIFHGVESRFSRFDPSSELSRFNAGSTGDFRASHEFIALISCAVAMHNRTRGVFEPGILRDLIAAGYDRSFEQISDDNPSSTAAPPHMHQSIADIVVSGSTVTAPPDLAIDFGGIGKDYAVDLAMAHLRGSGSFLISAGGDIRAVGDGPGGDGWLVSVAPAPGDAPLSILRLHDQALATSTTALRNWRRGGAQCHHIIDPRTHRPAATGVRAVSVVAPTAVEADVFAKTALILGVDEGLAFLDEQQTPGFFVRDDATCVQSAGWPGVPAGK